MERKEESDYPQELLDLFHEYQHGDIDRQIGEAGARTPRRVGEGHQRSRRDRLTIIAAVAPQMRWSCQSISTKCRR